MGRRRYLVDTSALIRLEKPPVGAVLKPLLEAGEVAVCAPVESEIRYSARNLDAFRNTVFLLSGYPVVRVHESTFRRAFEVQEALAERGRLRALSLVDLLTAAAAESANLPLLHYDADFDLVAEVTGQPAEWVVPAGAAD